MIRVFLNSLLLSRSDFKGEVYGGRWPTIADLIRERDHFTCQRCGEHGWQVHHRWPVHSAIKRGRLAFLLANQSWMLTTLCMDCHMEIHERMRRQMSKSDILAYAFIIVAIIFVSAYIVGK